MDYNYEVGTLLIDKIWGMEWKVIAKIDGGVIVKSTKDNGPTMVLTQETASIPFSVRSVPETSEKANDDLMVQTEDHAAGIGSKEPAKIPMDKAVAAAQMIGMDVAAGDMDEMDGEKLAELLQIVYEDWLAYDGHEENWLNYAEESILEAYDKSHVYVCVAVTRQDEFVNKFGEPAEPAVEIVRVFDDEDDAFDFCYVSNEDDATTHYDYFPVEADFEY